MRTGFEIAEPPAITLGVYAHNASARGVYESPGCQETGRLRSAEADGQPWHAVEMERRRPD